MIKFLKRNEYIKTKALAEECFGKSTDLDEYYSSDIFDGRVCVAENNGKICSMAHLKRVIATFADNTEKPVWYILYVGTSKDMRRQGYMDSVMNYILDCLKKESESFTFLVPVDKEIYYHFGFIHNWKFNENETDLLYADEGLTECYACNLNDNDFRKPVSLKKADTINDFKYTEFDVSAAYKYFDYFSIRKNKSNYSVPLDCLIWSEAVQTKCCELDNRCFIMRDKGDDMPTGCIPFCSENELSYYFKLQERYFNEILNIPFRAYYTDSDGVMLLKKAGILDNYEVTEDKEIFDYIYSGDELRTLSGRRFTKKRNHINKFMRLYDGRWEYRKLTVNDYDEITEFLKKWDENRVVSGGEIDIGEAYSGAETLEIEVSGILKIIKSPEIMSKIKVGGIYIDNKLCAFSVGTYNPLEKMAVIDVEKAFSEYDGLYQLMNREFLIHEFPQAELINREDDLGLPGLRQSKMSYNPIFFEKRYSIIQKDFIKN